MATWEFPCSEPIDAERQHRLGHGRDNRRAHRRHHGPCPSAGLAARPQSPMPTTARRRRHRRLRRPPAGDQRARERGLALARQGPARTIAVPDGSSCRPGRVGGRHAAAASHGSLDIRTASGRSRRGAVRGPAEIFTMSGDVKVADVAGEATMHTASGRISIRHAGGDVMAARTASGDVVIGAADSVGHRPQRQRPGAGRQRDPRPRPT